MSLKWTDTAGITPFFALMFSKQFFEAVFQSNLSKQILRAICLAGCPGTIQKSTAALSAGSSLMFSGVPLACGPSVQAAKCHGTERLTGLGCRGAPDGLVKRRCWFWTSLLVSFFYIYRYGLIVGFNIIEPVHHEELRFVRGVKRIRILPQNVAIFQIPRAGGGNR